MLAAVTAYAAPMGAKAGHRAWQTWAAALLAVPGFALADVQLAQGHADAFALNAWLSATGRQGGMRCTEPRELLPLPARLQGRVVLTGWHCGLRSFAPGVVRRQVTVQARLIGARYLQWPAQRVEWQESLDLDSETTNPGTGLRLWVGAARARVLPVWQADGPAEQKPDGSWERLSNAGATLATLSCGPRGVAPCEIGDFLVP